MSEIYEFHVAGLIGPVVRSALPEFSTGPCNRNSVLSGTASGPDEVDRVLRQLGDAGLTATHIVINKERRWRSPAGAPSVSAEPSSTEMLSSDGAVPVVDDDGAEHDVLD